MGRDFGRIRIGFKKKYMEDRMQAREIGRELQFIGGGTTLLEDGIRTQTVFFFFFPRLTSCCERTICI
jgi:hypothetical protein